MRARYFHRSVMLNELDTLTRTFPFKRCQRNRRIDHGAHDINKGYAKHCHFEKLRGLIDTRPDEQSTCAAALTREPVWRSELPAFNKPAGDVDKVIESVLLAQILCSIGLFVPLWIRNGTKQFNVRSKNVQAAKTRSNKDSFYLLDDQAQLRP